MRGSKLPPPADEPSLKAIVTFRSVRRA